MGPKTVNYVNRSERTDKMNSFNNVKKNFGFGMVVHYVISILEEKIFLKRKL